MHDLLSISLRYVLGIFSLAIREDNSEVEGMQGNLDRRLILQ
jgi:hypothetical protein